MLAPENLSRKDSTNGKQLLNCFTKLLWFCRSGDKAAAYFQNTIDVLANPWQDVLIYDMESWMVWKEVWDTFERDGVPKTDNLNDMQRYQQQHSCCHSHGFFDIYTTVQND